MKKAAPEESGEKAPLWIISFADMISLLMAFFVMLQTMAASNSNEFLTTGREKLTAISFEFRRNISGFGMPGLFGSPRVDRNMGFTQDQYSLDNGDTGPVTDEERDPQIEQVRRLFTQLCERAKMGRTRFEGKDQVFEVAPISFKGTSLELSEKSRQYLTQYVTILNQGDQLKGKSICVVGLAADLPDEERQWLFSERRARTVAQFIQSLLPATERGSVCWWGAGASTDAAADRSPCILIAVD